MRPESPGKYPRRKHTGLEHRTLDEIEMQGGATVAERPNESRRSTEGLRSADTAYAGAAYAFDEVFSFEHLYDCAKQCCNGVRWKASTQLFESSVLMWVANTRRELLEGKYRTKGFNHFTIVERGKTRHIQSVHISERMVQKCLVQHCLRPQIMPKLISANHATLPGHGTQTALKELKEHLRWWYARHGREGGVLVMDYHDYFGSIRHDKLKAMYAKLDMDERLYDLTCYFIDCFEGNAGLGLGSEISQISAVFYVNAIDHFIKDNLGHHCYARYMDDSYLIGDIADLELARGCVEAMSHDLGLTLNPKATQITRLDGGSFRYLKKRIFVTETGKIVVRLDRSNITRARHRVKANAAKLAAGEMTPEAEQQSWQSWEAYASDVDAHNTVLQMKAERAAALYKAFEGTPPRG